MPDLNANPSHESNEMSVEMDEATAEGTYSNLVMISHSSEEFVLDFIRVVPGMQKARVKSRIIITPQHAMRLLDALDENIERYEQEHGPIQHNEGGPSDPLMQFGGFGGEA